MDEDDWQSAKEIKNMGKYKCKICKKRFSEKSGLHHHVQLHSTDRPFACHLCTYTCKTKKYLTKHVKVVHVAATSHECSYCGKTFHFRSKLNDHLHTHTNLKPHKCEVCGKGFNSTYSLTTHRYIHQDSKPFKCLYCDYACRDSSTLRKHHERHSGATRVYQCATCSKNYSTKSKLRVHVMEAHLDVDLKTKPCGECGKMFKSTSALTTHIKVVHQRRYASECDICGLRVSNRYNMSSHLRTHIDLRPYKCAFDGCPKRYKDKSSLKKHAVIHYPDEQWVCKICDKRFTRPDRFKKHKRQHLPKAKSVMCDHCGVGFYNKNYLQSHLIRKHLHRQTFICDTCGFSAYNKPGLVAHIRHGHDAERDRQCKICHKKYKKHIYLKSHYWNTHFIKYKTNIRPKKVVVKEEPVEESEMTAEKLMEIVKHENTAESETDVAIQHSKGVRADDNSGIPAADDPGRRLEALFLDLLQPPPTQKYERKLTTVDSRCEEEAQRRIGRMLKRARRRKERERQILENSVNLNSQTDATVEEPVQNDLPQDPRSEGTVGEDSRTGNGEGDGVEETLEGNTASNEENECTENNNEKTAIIFNTHQCYECLKLFDTKEKLLEHCKEHYSICNDTIMKKCPFCDYVTNLNLARHIQKMHNINVKIGQARLKEDVSPAGSRYFYDVESEAVKKIDVIPSVKNLNKRASMRLDKLKRQNNNKTLQKTKLVKKDGEWVVETSSMKTDGLLLPDVKKLEGDYFGTLKKVATLAKDKGEKILYPCNKCEKICQTLAALKLHYRKHDPNKKPFKPKVWKHKLNGVTEVDKNIDSEQNRKIEMDINHRYEMPKPIANKHKCDPKLKAFYESNIKGGDVEFWHFLKIFNKMTKDNVNDFKDLDSRIEFGCHYQTPVVGSKSTATTDNINGARPSDIEINTTVRISRQMSKGAFKRVIRLSRKEYAKRNRLKERLREKIRNGSCV